MDLTEMFERAKAYRDKVAGARWRTPAALAAFGQSGFNRLNALTRVKQKLNLPGESPGVGKLLNRLPESAETTALVNSRLPNSSTVLTAEPKHVWRGFAGPSHQSTTHDASVYGSPSASYAATYGYPGRNSLPTAEGNMSYYGLAKYPAAGLNYGPDGAFSASQVGSKPWVSHAVTHGGKVPAYDVSDANVTGIKPQEQFLVVNDKARTLPSRAANSILSQLFKRV